MQLALLYFSLSYFTPFHLWKKSQQYMMADATQFPADDMPPEDGLPEDGLSEGELPDDGLSDGLSEDWPLDDEPPENGPPDDVPPDHGPSDNGPPDNEPPDNGPQEDAPLWDRDERPGPLPREPPKKRDPLAPDEPLNYPSAPQVGPDDFPRRQRDPETGSKHSCCLTCGTTLNNIYRIIPRGLSRYVWWTLVF